MKNNKNSHHAWNFDVDTPSTANAGSVLEEAVVVVSCEFRCFIHLRCFSIVDAPV